MILLFGPQGSGKGTQAEMLAARNKWRWFSTGQMFRDSADPEVHRRLDEGELIDDQLTNKVLDHALARVSPETQVILDGYPRNAAQAQRLLDKASQGGRSIDCIIEIYVPQEESVTRMLARGREDDTIEAIKRRLQIYHAETEPIIDLYKTRKVPYARVDGMGSVAEVQVRIQEAIDKACEQK